MLLVPCSFRSPSSPFHRFWFRSSRCAFADSSRNIDLSSLPINIHSINENLKRAEYAVRGAIVLRAQEIEREIRENRSTRSFDEILYCNIGNPQQVGQMPLSFPRQVLALLEYPALLTNEHIRSVFPSDVIARVNSLLANIPGGVGAYSESKGVRVIREHIAAFIERRDGFSSNPESLFLSDGATPAITKVIHMLTRDQHDAMLIPVPTYPLYTAAVTLLGGKELFYHLNEEKDWGMDVSSLQNIVEKARSEGYHPRGIVVINPGNPAGNCLSLDNMRSIVRFCAKEGIAILADEVYQENIYKKDSEFVSFKKVVCEMKEECPNVQLFSFHSTSKGFLGECGHRGGYCEAYNVEHAVEEEMYKFNSLSLCPNLIGQVMVDLMVNPPKPGDESFEQYEAEKQEILGSLSRKAAILAQGFNSMDGVSCNEPAGAMYAFPRIQLPPKAVEEAKKKGKPADFLYCMELLEETGICVVPGSGFQQEPGTFHFRTTFLPPEEKIPIVVERMRKFHEAYLRRYA